MLERPWSRRRFLVTGALAAAAAGLPAGKLRAQTAQFTRYNLASAPGKKMLEGYKTAIKALLKLPPTDQRNWYRNALIHTLDCPHGNWWLFPWHRAYIGYFEQTVRQYSGMSDFAFPYWDWTASPQVPADFFGADNPLDPTSSYFIASFDAFKKQYEKPVNDFYAGLTPAQQQALDTRSKLGGTPLSTAAQLFAALDPSNPQGGDFFNGAASRCLTAAQPTFASPPSACTGNCVGTAKAVSQETINSALAPTTYVPFSSGSCPQHSGSSSITGVLEGQPHNLVHNCTGGFMEAFMSPVDPIFFMHHSNIERYWLIWTDKQQKAGKPTLPPKGTEYDNWAKETFLFYVNSQGQTLSTTAGDFATVGSFDYVYSPPTTMPAPKARDAKTFASAAAMPADLVQQAGAASDGPELFAEVPVDPQGRPKDKVFHVLINPPAGLDPTDVSSPHHAATVAFFGNHGHAGHGPTNFLVPLSPALRKMAKAGLLKKGEPIQIFVATEDQRDGATKAPKPVAKKVDAAIQSF